MTDLQLYAIDREAARPLDTPPGLERLHQLDLPEGIYEGMRTFGRARFLYLERHLERAQESLASLGWRPLDDDTVRRGLDAATRAFSGDDAQRDCALRLDVFEGAREVLGTSTRYLLALMPFSPVPPDVLSRGVRVGLARGKARHTPSIKRNEWITRRRGTGPGDGGYYEHLLLDEGGRILEGSSSNVFCVRRGGLWTAKAEVLGGIQRAVFLELAERAGIPARLEAFPLERIGELDEMFLTSSSRAAVPITAVEDRPVGDGRPGPVWKRLLDAYRDLTDEACPAVGAHQA